MERTILYDVHDASIYPLTPTDGTTAPSYGAAIDLPGVSQIGLDPQIVEAMLEGDGRIIDQRSKLQGVTFSPVYGYLALAALAAIMGGTVTTGTGTGDPDDHSRYVRKASDQMPSFGAAFLVSEVSQPNGAAKLYVYNSRATGGTLFGSQTNAYGQPTFEARGIPLEDPNTASNDGAIFAVDLEGTGTDLPADGAAFLGTIADLT